MYFNVSGLLKDVVGATRHYQVSEPVDMADTGLSLAGPVEGHLDMTRTSRGVLVEGHLLATVTQSCSRCLEPVLSAVAVDFGEEFLQTLDMGTGMPLDVPQDDPAILIDGHHMIDLDDLVRQYLLAWAPMHPLCRPECAGLCPQCGRNLNEGPCSCVAAEADPRWSVLGRLLKERRSA